MKDDHPQAPIQVAVRYQLAGGFIENIINAAIPVSKTDLITVIAQSTALADATATAIGNMVKEATDITQGLDAVQQIDGIAGALIIVGDHFGVWGDIEIVST